MRVVSVGLRVLMWCVWWLVGDRLYIVVVVGSGLLFAVLLFISYLLIEHRFIELMFSIPF